MATRSRKALFYLFVCALVAVGGYWTAGAFRVSATPERPGGNVHPSIRAEVRPSAARSPAEGALEADSEPEFRASGRRDELLPAHPPLLAELKKGPPLASTGVIPADRVPVARPPAKAERLEILVVDALTSRPLSAAHVVLSFEEEGAEVVIRRKAGRGLARFRRLPLEEYQLRVQCRGYVVFEESFAAPPEPGRYTVTLYPDAPNTSSTPAEDAAGGGFS